MRIPCPACRQPLDVPDHAAGQRLGCPHCRQPFAVPAVTAAPPAPAPQGPAPHARPPRPSWEWTPRRVIWVIAGGVFALIALGFLASITVGRSYTSTPLDRLLGAAEAGVFVALAYAAARAAEGIWG